MGAQPRLKAIEDNIAFIDLKAQQDQITDPIHTAINKVLAHGKYIMGPEVIEFEKQLSEFCSVKHVISCSSGTDALIMTLLALDIKAGDAVFVPSFTFAATAESVAVLGATPIFVDVNIDDYNISNESLKSAIQIAKNKGLNLAGIIAVDLFGLPANYDKITQIANAENMWLIDDAAQSLGAKYNGKSIANMGIASTTSFFPAKPLGCYGDGGAIFTNDDDLANKLRSIRVHGKGSCKYDNVRLGVNGRLDTIQAAILIEKLKIFPREIEMRNNIAKRYNDAFKGIIQTPPIEDNKHKLCTWAQYTLNITNGVERRSVQDNLKDARVPSAIYYPLPLHKQTCYKNYPSAPDMGNCEALSQTVLSLPMHPYISENTQDYIITEVKKALA